MAGPGRRRRADHLERRHAAGGGLRPDRGAAAAGRPDRRARRDARVRAARQLAHARGERDHGHVGVSAAAVGPLADGDMGRFAALSAALALVTAVVLVVAGMLKLGAITDFVSKPVITGFLFGLGLFITVGPTARAARRRGRRRRLLREDRDILEELGSAHGATAAVGLASVALLFALKRFAPGAPRHARRAGAGDRRLRAARPRRARGGRGRGAARRAAGPRRAGREPARPRRAAALGLRDHDPHHRGGRGGARPRHQGRLRDRRQPRALRHGGGQRAVRAHRPASSSRAGPARRRRPRRPAASHSSPRCSRRF